jgi:hypothetical protein
MLALAAPAMAAPQAARRQPAKATAEAGPDLFGGYSYTRSGEAGLNGVQFSFSTPYRRSLRLVADLAVHSGSFAGADLSQLTLMVGARLVSRPGPRLRPFAQALLGIAHTSTKVSSVGLESSSTGFGPALGVGADYGLSRRLSARGQAELLLLHSGGGWDSDPRLSVGVAYRF